ncbi:hypothetical protein [Neptuniibacter sp. QD37_11]|uniref:hypothetical protein n=1 Tax=Neptuniibacter sp. QD37_11 TaxID=3398209 RepID=UPI0039F5F0DE
METVFSIEEIRHYLNRHSCIDKALSELSEKAVVDAQPESAFNPLTCAQTDKNLAKYEAHIGMLNIKTRQRELYRKTEGKEGRYWMALSPRWIPDDATVEGTEYRIGYWVNYGDNNTYGNFTVEQIQLWFENPEIQLHQLGGTKES